ISYISGNSTTINHQKALQLFLKSATKGSSLEKYYIGDCYYYGYRVIKNLSYSFN
ncbi:6755_t:CDS:1, partial [Racocetra persica]